MVRTWKKEQDFTWIKSSSLQGAILNKYFWNIQMFS